MADLPITPLFFDKQATYDAKTLRQPFRDFLYEGVVQPNDFLVVPKGGTAANPDAGGGARNLSVDVLGGSAWIAGDDTPATQGLYRAYLASTDNNTITANSSGSTRIDSVILEMIDTPTYKGRVRVVAGTPGSGVPPTLPNNALLLATVTITSGDTVIDGANVTDTRTRAIAPYASSAPAADVTITDTTWVNITSITLTLARAASVRIWGYAKFSSTGASSPDVALAIVDGSTLLRRTGSVTIGNSTSAFGANPTLHMAPGRYDLAAGAHTLRLQGYKNAVGLATVVGGSAALTGYTDYVTRLMAEVVG